MSIINQEVFVDIMTNPSHPQYSALRNDLIEGCRLRSHPNPVDREAALQVLETAQAYVTRTGFYWGKFLRPYTYDKFEYLDRSQPWWGFEFETGYGNGAMRSVAIAKALELAVNGVSFDNEGDGYSKSEVTFSPAEMSAYEDGTAPAYQFIQYLHNSPELCYRSNNEYIGTHLNMSLPDMNRDHYDFVARALNNSIRALPQTFELEDGVTVDTRLKFFGRAQVYMGCISRRDWIEMKLFRTTYDINQFEDYVRTAKVLTRIAMAVRDRAPLYSQHDDGWEPRLTVQFGCDNMLEMWQDESVQPNLIVNPEWCGGYSRQYLSGGSYSQSFEY